MYRRTTTVVMVRSLFDLCMDAIQDHIRAGTLVNLDHLPTEFRLLILAKFPSYNDTEKGAINELPLSLRRSELYNHFEQLGTLEFSDCDQLKTLMSTILAEIERPGSSLASTLVSLRLRVCFIDHQFQEKPMVELDIYRLIAACRNVRRLFLKSCSTCWKNRSKSSKTNSPDVDSQGTAWIDRGRDLDVIMDALAAGGAGRAPLEELTLHRFLKCSFRNNYSALESLQTLHLHRCYLSSGELWRLIEPCRKTLSTLNVEDTHINCDELSDGLKELFWFLKQDINYVAGLPDSIIDLPALTSLTVNESHWYSDFGNSKFFTVQRCLLSYETLGRLQRGMICIYDICDQNAMKTLADCLPSEVEISFVFSDCLFFSGFWLTHQWFGQRIVELHIDLRYARFPILNDFDELIDQLTSIRVLVLRGIGDHEDHYLGDLFLRRFLSDPRRCKQLRRLKIRWDLEPETLQLLFRNCVNLEWLGVGRHTGSEELAPITDEHLKMWAANGAKPKQIDFDYETNITAAGIEPLWRNCGGDLKASFLDERGRLITTVVEEN